jgi:hypothetical protein
MTRTAGGLDSSQRGWPKASAAAVARLTPSAARAGWPRSRSRAEPSSGTSDTARIASSDVRPRRPGQPRPDGRAVAWRATSQPRRNSHMRFGIRKKAVLGLTRTAARQARRMTGRGSPVRARLAAPAAGVTGPERRGPGTVARPHQGAGFLPASGVSWADARNARRGRPAPLPRPSGPRSPCGGTALPNEGLLPGRATMTDAPPPAAAPAAEPASLPRNPRFSSGPCAKPPGWSLDALRAPRSGGRTAPRKGRRG